jgi:hypothetical protein
LFSHKKEWPEAFYKTIRLTPGAKMIVEAVGNLLALGGKDLVFSNDLKQTSFLPVENMK